MRNVLKSFLKGLAITSALVISSGAQSQNQSLGDYARAIKKNKPAQSSPTKPEVYDNENMPTSGTLSVVGNGSSDETSADSKDQAKTDAPADAKAADPSKADPKANGNERIGPRIRIFSPVQRPRRMDFGNSRSRKNTVAENKELLL